MESEVGLAILSLPVNGDCMVGDGSEGGAWTIVTGADQLNDIRATNRPKNKPVQVMSAD